jgi:hypothetical protein
MNWLLVLIFFNYSSGVAVTQVEMPDEKVCARAGHQVKKAYSQVMFTCLQVR